MALVPKIDPNKIFASNAPSQDKPAAFDNYEKGMDETRKNLGRPTIPQLNYLHQTADQKILWIHQNGGGLPYDASIEYAEKSVTLKDGELKQLVDGAWVEVKPKALPATAITTASSQNQQQINDFGGAKWYAKVGGYELGATVKLDNGDTVQSTKAANIANPNVDMTAWKKSTVDADALKQYATLALATADIANIALNKNVFVSEAANGGYWYKATAGATSLTKSPYDPVTQAKTYADQNKLDIRKIQHSYQGGNLIGTKSLRYLNFGLSSGFVISAATHYDSVVIPVNADDVLFILNDKQIYAPAKGAAYAFFAEDPYLNRSQARIVDNRTSPITDPETSLPYIRVTVPVGANYLILNTRYNNSAGIVSNVFNWAIHSGAFNSSYGQGTEVIAYIDDVKVPTVVEVEKLSAEAIKVAATEANAAEANAKGYADSNKLDLKQLTVEYKDGNLIGVNSLKLIGTGLSVGRAITSNTALDSVIIPVVAGDVLYIHNNLSTYSTSLSDTYAFFALNPAQNTAQTRIPPVTSKINTDPVTAIKYMAATVPENAKFLMLNVRSSASVTQWSVRKGVWDSSYTQGTEILSKVKGIPLYNPPNIFENEPKVSVKNLYKGTVLRKFRVSDNGAYATADNNAALSGAIPVVFGQSYTISGIPRKTMGTTVTRIMGLENDSIPTTGFVKILATTNNDIVTVVIDDPRIKYILFPLSKEAPAEIIDLKHIPLQVELGEIETSYEPYYHTDALLRAMAAKSDSDPVAPVDPQPLKTRQIVSQFNELDIVRDPKYVTLAPMEKQIAPLGISYSVLDNTDSSSNNLYAKVDANLVGNKSVYAYLMKTLDGIKQVGVLKHTPFTTPSGSLDNPESFSFADKYPNYLTTHPSMDYTETPIAGFKYWMVSSTFPPTAEGGVKWEDEDLFVSNDAQSWQRVRSMYETDKSYTTATLRLPPQTLVTSGSRRNAFLPSPIVGTTFEVSVPANNGQSAVERQTYTVHSNLPWKHDPCLLIDGGYVYVYHSFNLWFNERNDKKSHFFVCVRTNNGIDWDFVRSDGSTLRITEETSKQVFTKGADGKYNYLNYAYDDSRSNPEIVKFGEGDYELFYGRNFTTRFHGTTPYSFDFLSPVTVKDLGNMNHPTLIYNNGVLYNLSNYYCHTSTDRGATWTKLPNYPMWRGGVGGFNYKKSSCIGEGGKFIVADVVRVAAQAYEVNHRAVSNDVNTMNLFEFPSFADFLDKANNGLVDAYIDVQITKVNLDTKSRTVITLPNISLKNASLTGGLVLERLKIADLELSSGDVIHFNVTLNSRNGAKITFGGLEIS